MFSQKFSHECGRRIITPSERSRTIRGRAQQFHGMIHSNPVIRRHLLDVWTRVPLNSPPPPHSEYSRRLSPCCCSAFTSRCRNVSETFGNVVKRRAIVGLPKCKKVARVSDRRQGFARCNATSRPAAKTHVA